MRHTRHKEANKIKLQDKDAPRTARVKKDEQEQIKRRKESPENKPQNSRKKLKKYFCQK